MEIYTDPATGCEYTVDPVTGQSRWLDELRPASEQPTQPHAVHPSVHPSVHPTQELPSQEAPPRGQPPQEWPSQEAPPRGQPPQEWPLGRFESPRRSGGARRALGVVAVVTVLVAGLMVVMARRDGGAPGSGGTSGRSAPTAQAAPRTPGMGSAVRDGKFEFRVTGKRTAKTLGNDLINTRASGTFLLVSVTVRNVSEQSKTFVSIAQKLHDTRDREYTADARAALYLGQVKNLFDRIGPGGSVSGTLVFDVPAGATPDRLELHDSLLSGGVDVRLR